MQDLNANLICAEYRRALKNALEPQPLPSDSPEQ
jgi:hypothetical protein